MDFLASVVGKVLSVSAGLLQKISSFIESIKSGNATDRRALAIAFCALLLLAIFYGTALAAPSDFPKGEIITVDAGTSLSTIAAELYDQHVIKFPLIFKILIKVSGRDKKLRAGDYLFAYPASTLRVAYALISGAYGLSPVRIVIPEGVSIADMSKLYAAQFPRFNVSDFTSLAVSNEGELYPDTYELMPSVKAQQIYDTMRANFDSHVNKLAPQIAKSGHSTSSIIIMASILEREAGNEQDRRTIADILWRRLAKGIPLQVDAPFVYSIGKGTAALTRIDLTSEDPYNTYKHKGLPPTPIGNPGIAAISDAISPIKNNYWFFLADKNGVTHYAVTYDQHLKNKALYIDQ